MENALVLAPELLTTVFAKTTHGLLRRSGRYRVVGVVDPMHAGQDAGAAVDGLRDIPVYDSIAAGLAAANPPPTVAVVGVATPGGVMPDALRDALLAAADAGLTLVNGLHQLLGDDLEIVRRVEAAGGDIIDIRRPPKAHQLHFWSGEILALPNPRLAVLGTDCAVGKRTTCVLLRDACRQAGLAAEMIYTGQTGWLQGITHGFILDAIPNDFVCGELEHAILACHRDTNPDLILIEGQSSLRNPSGPCGSELIISGAVDGVILQHTPARRYFLDHEEMGCEIPPVADEIALIRLLGAEVWALTLNTTGMAPEAIEPQRRELAASLGLPVILPLQNIEALVLLIERRLAARRL